MIWHIEEEIRKTCYAAGTDHNIAEVANAVGLHEAVLSFPSLAEARDSTAEDEPLYEVEVVVRRVSREGKRRYTRKGGPLQALKMMITAQDE